VSHVRACTSARTTVRSARAEANKLPAARALRDGMSWFIDEAHFTSAGNAEVEAIDDIVTQTIRL
jgi:hypothetical protein